MSEPDLELLNRGLAVTVEDDDGVVGVGGVVLCNEKEGEMWIRISQRVHKFKTLDAILAGFNILVEGLSDVDIYCRVKEGFAKGNKLAKWLGFEFEEVKKYNETNYLVYRLKHV